ncbi:MAG TPA: NEW3 domain-containing protein [Lysobacter sp.]|nr:NEW3 domain-containing protein [Lysobacter sp.]
MITLDSRSRKTWTRSIFPLLLAPIGLAAWGSAAAATTYHVRTDGGTSTQCTGKADAPYSGSGSGQACAWKHPYYALPSGGTPRIAGGDTLIIGSGDYMIGYGAPGMAGQCAAGDRNACSLGRIPSGPSTTAKTRILGNSAKPPRLWGAERTWSVLDLTGSNNVEVGHLEITDKSSCISAHSTAGAACNRSSAPYGNWASMGLIASNSSNVWLHDVNIHGMAANGINAGKLTNWTMERVRINANGWAGWDANVGSDSSNSGQIVLRDIEIAWNGCGEDPNTGAIVNCWAQKAGGYGDGLGTITTGGQWLIEDAFVHHNTSDGLDLLYLDGAAGTSVTLRRVYAVANAGNQVKTRGNMTLDNSVLVGHCSYFAGKDYMQAGDQCRASGNALSVSLGKYNVANIRHNTIISEGDVVIMTEGGDASNTVNMQHNAIIGMNDYLARVSGNSTELSAGHFAYNSAARVNYAGNLFWNVKNNQCPSGSICGKNPGLTNMTLAKFDATPLAGSPLVDAVAVISGVNTDFLMQPRPVGGKADIGAYEFQTSDSTTPTPDPTPTPTPDPTPTPVCTRNTPTLGLGGPTTAVTAGSTVSYSLSVRNNDTSACSNTSFALARTVPSGWTGTLSASSVSLAPGATGYATLRVTSPATAVSASYNIGAGTSSAAGSKHTASGSSTYSVKAPETISGELTGTISTDSSIYRAGKKVRMFARVLKSGNAVGGASVRFTLTKPNGIKIVKTVTTDSYGQARWDFITGTGSSSIGKYQASYIATSGSATTTAATSFTVIR